MRSVDAAYLVGADGPRSTVRQALGYSYSGEEGVVQDFFGGRMYAIYLRASDFYKVVPHPPAWMNVTFNRDRRAFMAAVDGRSEFAFHTQLRAHEREEEITHDRAVSMFQAAVGATIDIDVLSRGSWIAGYALVAERFQAGRVFVAGDAAHLFTPAGGLGYNTAVEDAVNLGWKLGAVVRGQAGPELLATYELERQPIARRNTRFARAFADSIGLYEPVPEIEDDTAEGESARRVRELRSVLATISRRSSSATARLLRRMLPMFMSPLHARVAGHPIFGCLLIALSLTHSASNGRSCAL